MYKIFKKISQHVESIQVGLFNLLKNTFYYNYSYRPIGIYHTSKVYSVSVKDKDILYKEIYTDLVSQLAISEDLYLACADYYKPHLWVKATYLVVEVPGGRVHTDNKDSIAIIAPDNVLIADVSFSYNYGKTPKAHENNIFKQRFFTRPEKYKGTVFTMLTGGSGVNNYSHWLLDVLPRLHLLKRSGLFEQIDYFLVPAYKHDFQKQTLQLLGISKDKIIEGNTHTHIEADTLIASSAPRGNDSIIPDWVQGFLRRSFLKESYYNPHSPKRIYISRKDSRYRRVVNEKALALVLNNYGFQTVVLSRLSFEEKISLFASADTVLSATGSGLTNIVFCRKGTKVIEIFSEGFVVGPFYDLAPKAGLDYKYIICKAGTKPKTHAQGRSEDVVVDIEAVEQLLIKELNYTSLR